MDFTLTPTTVLEAVNEMLTAIGSVPVNTLDAPGSSDVAIAVDTLASVSRAVQTRGWWFNTEYGRTFAASGGEIIIPQSVLAVRPSRGNVGAPAELKLFALRSGKLYNLTTNSFTGWVGSIRADTIIHLDFEDLPESARRYITIRAARIFQTKTIGDEGLGVFTDAHEAESWDLLEGDHVAHNPVSSFYMERVRRMGRMARDDIGRRSQAQRQPQGGN